MMFLLRAAFWLSIVLVLLPSGGSKSPATAGDAEFSATNAAVAASATVSDMRGFCSRQPEACSVGAQVAVAFGQRAQAGAKLVFDFVNEKMLASDKAADAPSRSAARIAADSAKPSQHTLTAIDLAPGWRGPPRRDTPSKGA